MKVMATLADLPTLNKHKAAIFEKVLQNLFLLFEKLIYKVECPDIL